MKLWSRTAAGKDAWLARDLRLDLGFPLSTADVRTLRRAQLTLQAWRTAECNGDFERNELNQRPLRVHHPVHLLERYTFTPVPDREAGALRRVKAVCEKYGLHYFYQTDPRGCTLYVSLTPLNDVNYLKGVACCV